jgi:hypothetical protein
MVQVVEALDGQPDDAMGRRGRPVRDEPHTTCVVVLGWVVEGIPDGQRSLREGPGNISGKPGVQKSIELRFRRNGAQNT